MLLTTIQNIKIVKPGVTLIYVNYDIENGKLAIFEDTEDDSCSKLFVYHIQMV